MVDTTPDHHGVFDSHVCRLLTTRVAAADRSGLTNRWNHVDVESLAFHLTVVLTTDPFDVAAPSSVRKRWRLIALDAVLPGDLGRCARRVHFGALYSHGRMRASAEVGRCPGWLL
jgi:hypothetical protein